MYITTPKRKNGSIVVRLVESFRKDGKVKNRIIKTIGQSKDLNKIKLFKSAAKKLLEEHKKDRASAFEFLPVDLSRFLCMARYNKGFEDIFGLSYKHLGFEDLIRSGREASKFNHILRNLVLVRLFSPESKLKSCSVLKERFSEDISHKRVLTMMDHLSEDEEEIRERIFRSILSHSSDLSLLLFDVTTLYFESEERTDLQDFGYSKDGKFNEVQVVLAVLADAQGLPLAYEVFPGQTGEVKTLQVVLNKAIKKYKVDRIRVVADRAMFSDNNFDFFKNLSQEKISAEYVVSCPLRKLPKKIQKDILDFKIKQDKKEDIKEENIKEGEEESKSFYEFHYKGRRMIVSYSQKIKFREEKKRQRILDKLKTLCSEDNKIRSNRLIKNKGLKKYLKPLKGEVEIDKTKIADEAKWDGLYGLCSNIENKSPNKLLDMYRSLWKIEELFRINKHTLKMRPIYHRIPRRIKAHILICFLAYATLRWTEIFLKKAGCFLSPQELIETLKEVELFVIKDKKRKAAQAYCIPKALSKKAHQIYSLFQKSFPDTPYPLKTTALNNKM